MATKALRRVREAIILPADESRQEETTAWCNRDLVPMPPSRRTWSWSNFMGVTALYATPPLSPLPNSYGDRKVG